MCFRTALYSAGKFSASLKTGVMMFRSGRSDLARDVFSDVAMLDLLFDPGDDFVEHITERRGSLEAEDLLSFGHVRHALLDVVLERFVGNVLERLLVAVDLLPDHLGQLEHGGRLGGRDVEVLV